MKVKKLSINRLAVGNLKTHKKRYTVLIIGIILAMIFSSGSVFFISCINSSNTAIQHKKLGKQEAICTLVTEEQINKLIDENIIEPKVGYGHVLASVSYNSADKSRATALAWLDDNAKEYYCQTVIEGRYPEDAGEIAIEKTMLSRIDKSAEVGEKITLSINAANGSEYMEKTIKKTYTLVGILYDKYTNIEYSYYDTDVIFNMPTAFVSEKETVELGGKERLISFCDFKENKLGRSYYWDFAVYDMDMAVHSIQTFAIGTLHGTIAEDVASDIRVVVMLTVMLTVGSCFVIVNSFASNLNERKKQIGLLRAVGTTKRQIIRIFGREALIISLICAPISILISYFAVKLVAYLMGEYFIFVPNIAVLIITTLVSVICVMLAALIPLVRISKISPMQAIRNTELMRRMKNKRIHSQKQFNASKLLAKRNMMFSRFRQVTVCVLLIITIVISCLGMSYVQANKDYKYGFGFDYRAISMDEGGRLNALLNYQSNKFSEGQRREIAEHQDVAAVYGEKTYKINMLVNGVYPDYLTIADMYTVEGRFADAYTWENTEYIPPEEREISSYYSELKNKVGYSQEYFASSMRVLDSAIIAELEENVIDGKINIDKINSGEEVIVLAPEKIGYYHRNLSNGALDRCLVDISESPKGGKYAGEYYEKYIRASAESCFHAGDEITLSTLVSDTESNVYNGDGNITRYDKTVKIGAVINKDSTLQSSNFLTGIEFYTTTSGKTAFGYQPGYDRLMVDLKDECTADMDEFMKTELSGILPDGYIDSRFEDNEYAKRDYKASMTMLLSAILLFTCICASLINNSVTAQIRESKRTIGTLRAVGASVSDLTRCYSLQILSMLGTGTICGAVIYTAAHIIIRKYTELSYLPWLGLLVAVILFAVCFLNLRLKIKKLTKDSVVDNIREL
ncbi:MAG: FtsX-like permease family protein [Faecalibacterium sp.]|nr:FtsX-like permease family protein [Ruminococcus sp.]MCM1391338.1 FtsX-like permease family protein [Ruminococcus sp.]MCM1484897.1 FtsX-like permease family protein [Faecalibacterium sp.]